MYKALFGLVLAVIVLGAALAMWSETLTVNVTVGTGKVDVSIVEAVCSDTGRDPGLDKDVAWCTVTPSEDGNSVTVTIGNAYPGYKVDVYLTVKNVGTIPVKLGGWSSNNPSVLSVDVENPRGGQPGGGQGQPTVPQPTVIDPGETHTYTLSIEVLDGAAQSSSYTFTVTLTFVQWNAG